MPEWTEPMKALCRGRCGDMGEPPCWKLPDLSSDCDDVEPCQECQADRIAALEAENERLRAALTPFAHLDPDNPDTTQELWETIMGDRVKDWFDYGEFDAARAALQENDA